MTGRPNPAPPIAATEASAFKDIPAAHGDLSLRVYREIRGPIRRTDRAGPTLSGRTGSDPLGLVRHQPLGWLVQMRVDNRTSAPNRQLLRTLSRNHSDPELPSTINQQPSLRGSLGLRIVRDSPVVGSGNSQTSGRRKARRGNKSCNTFTAELLRILSALRPRTTSNLMTARKTSFRTGLLFIPIHLSVWIWRPTTPRH